MIHLSLLGQRERLHAGDQFFPAEFSMLGRQPLHAQWRTHHALSEDDANIVLNTYPTGTGKTIAALLYLRELAARGARRSNCLFIAPTNELIRQHAHDIQGFCERNALPYRVLTLTRETMDVYAQQLAPETPGMPRRASKLMAILEDPRILDTEPGAAWCHYVLVTNPDIFYQAIFPGYGRNEERSVMKVVLSGFDYLVVDEFHYYHPKQIATFLFFLSFWRQFGIFDDGAKACLLSATPSEEVLRYLRDLNVKLAEISPDNEPAEERQLEVAALAPVELDVLSLDECGDDGVLEVVRRKASMLREWLEHEQGAVISGALWRINLIRQALLRAGISPQQMARLTGLEKQEARASASQRDLILATPTVDLGYNFDRPDKQRQSLDFLLFDALFPDEFIQRLGRAGRVLGKSETTTPSRAIAVVPRALAEVLKSLQGHPVSRAELRATLAMALRTGQLHERNALFEYVASGAIEEAFLPILRLQRMGGSAAVADVQDLFEQTRRLFGASDRGIYQFERLQRTTARYLREREVFEGAPTSNEALVEHILQAREDRGLRLWIASAAGERQLDEARTRSVVGALRSELGKPDAPRREHVGDWAIEAYRQYATRRASFSFRESFEPPLARIFDPDLCVSSRPGAEYDAFHIVQNCEAEFLDPHEWSKRSGMSAATSGTDRLLLYAVVSGLRAPEQRLRLSFHLRIPQELPAWEAANVCKMTALLGLEVVAEVGELAPEVMDAIRERFVPAFAAPSEGAGGPIGGTLMSLARERGLRLHTLRVDFASGGAREYRMVLGTQALLAAAHLRGLCAMYHRRRAGDYSDPIWC